MPYVEHVYFLKHNKTLKDSSEGDLLDLDRMSKANLVKNGYISPHLSLLKMTTLRRNIDIKKTGNLAHAQS